MHMQLYTDLNFNSGSLFYENENTATAGKKKSKKNNIKRVETEEFTMYNPVNTVFITLKRGKIWSLLFQTTLLLGSSCTKVTEWQG